MSVAAKQLNQMNQRSEQRDGRFSGDFSCILVPKDDESRGIPIKPLDVSKRGLGFIVKEALPRGSFFWLMIGTSRLRVELAYCNSHLGIDNLYRCGIFLREEHGDLAELCRGAGLLLEQHTPYY